MIKIKSQLSKMSQFFQSAAVVVIASLFVMSVVYAASTIGTNITTEGTVEVSGAHASTTGFMVIGTALDATLSPSAGDLFVSNNATVTTSLHVGSNATITNTLEINGAYASTTGYLAVGTDFSALMSGGDIFNSGNATSSGNLSVGGFASTTGYLKVGGGVIDMSTGTPTTTPGIFSRDRTNSTSTVSVGDIDDGSAATVSNGCLEMAVEGVYYNCMVDAGVGDLNCVIGRCN